VTAWPGYRRLHLHDSPMTLTHSCPVHHAPPLDDCALHDVSRHALTCLTGAPRAHQPLLRWISHTHARGNPTHRRVDFLNQSPQHNPPPHWVFQPITAT